MASGQVDLPSVHVRIGHWTSISGTYPVFVGTLNPQGVRVWEFIGTMFEQSYKRALGDCMQEIPRRIMHKRFCEGITADPPPLSSRGGADFIRYLVRWIQYENRPLVDSLAFLREKGISVVILPKKLSLLECLDDSLNY